MSLLDDLLEAGEGASFSQFSILCIITDFDFLPSLTTEPFRYDTPDLTKTSPPTELFSAPADPFLRSTSAQLREAQQSNESQRREIQTLWKQLADHEASRAADRAETDRLREELVALKSSGIGGTGDAAKMARLEQRCLEAEHTTRMTEKNFQASLEIKENESRVARQELQKVAAQLSAIRVSSPSSLPSALTLLLTRSHNAQVVLGGRFEAFQR